MTMVVTMLMTTVMITVMTMVMITFMIMVMQHFVVVVQLFGKWLVSNMNFSWSRRGHDNGHDCNVHDHGRDHGHDHGRTPLTMVMGKLHPICIEYKSGIQCCGQTADLVPLRLIEVLHSSVQP